MEIRSSRSRNPLSRLYDEEGLAPDIRRSITLILIGNLLGTLNGTVCYTGTTALVGLATSLGATDLTFGILSAITYAASLLSLPYSTLVNRTHKRKKYLLTIGLISRAIWLFLGMIPLFVPASPEKLRLWTLIFMLGVTAMMAPMIQVCWFPWYSDLTPQSIQSRTLSIRDVIISVASILFGLLVAHLLDTLPADTRYLIIFIVGATPGILDMVCFGFVKEVYTAEPAKTSMIQLLKTEILKSKPFMRFTIFWTLWYFGMMFGYIYFATYTMNSMGLSYMQIMIFGTCASCLCSIFMSPMWGKAIFRFGAKNSMYVAGIGAALAPMFFWLQTPNSVIPTLLYYFVGTMFTPGTTLACTTLQVTTTPSATRSSYLAVFSCVTQLAGATLGSLASGSMLNLFTDNNWLAAGFVDRYKIVFTIGVIIRLAAVLIIVPTFEKDSERTKKDLVSWFLHFGRTAN